MAIYWCFWILITILVLISDRKFIYSIFFNIIFILLFIFVGFRYEVGVDREDYQKLYDYFYSVPFSESIFYTDPAYGFLNYLGNNLGFSEVVFVNVICAFIFFTSFYLFSKKYNSYWIPLFVSYTYLIVVVSMNYVRQSVSIPLVMLAIYFLTKNDISKFLFFIFVAALFHKTAIVFLILYPLYFIYKFKLNNYIVYVYFMASIVILTFGLYFSSKSTDNIYLSGDEISSSGAVFRISHHFLAILFYFLYRAKFKSIYDKSMIYIDYLCFLIFYCLILSFFYSTMADRFNLYLMVFDIIIYTTLYDKLNFGSRYIFLIILFIFFTISFYLWFNYGVWADFGWIPYQNYIFKYFSNVF